MRRECLICGKDTPLLQPICDDCFSRLTKVTEPIDEKTGRPLKSGYQGQYRQFKYLESSRSYCLYDDLCSKIIKEFKYNGHFRISTTIAKKITTLINVSADFVVPVPAPVTTLLARGYNQSALLAKKLSNMLGVTYLSPLKSIKKRRQVGQTFKQRQENIKGTILPKKGFEKFVKGKVIIVIDDVFTTGSTLEEVSKVLRFMGAKNVFCFTFAITP